MSTENLKNNDHRLTIFIFLGSASFTALFFLLQSKDTIKNYDFFVTSVAITSILFIILAVARLNISVGRIHTNTPLSKIVSWLGVVGFLLIIIVLTLLIITQVNYIVGSIVGIFGIGIYVLIDIATRKSNPNW